MCAAEASEQWKIMVLRSMKPPAWLSDSSADRSLVISSRMRYARCLTGHHFPNCASDNELREIAALVQRACQDLGLDWHSKLTDAEREFLVGCRLISPEFAISSPGRACALSRDRSLSLMVNEEDHLRIQALTAGWSILSAKQEADDALARLQRTLEFARSEPYGLLTASPFNSGAARRASALFHLVGLMHTKRIHAVLRALSESGIIVRGIFGEATRPIGGFFQASWTGERMAPFIGAGDYLIEEETRARDSVPLDELADICRQTITYAVSKRDLSLADSYRILGYVRWGCAAGAIKAEIHLADLDRELSTIDLHGRSDEGDAARTRARHLRTLLEPLIAK